MTWRFHALFGINSLWLPVILSPGFINHDLGTLSAISVFGALLPDLDASESKIKHVNLPGTPLKPFLFLSELIHRTDKHRGVLHSLVGLGMIALLSISLYLWEGSEFFVVFLLGYASHLFADAATKSGIQLLYPNAQRFYLLTLNWRITTGSSAEEALSVPLILGVMSLLLWRNGLFKPF